MTVRRLGRWGEKLDHGHQRMPSLNGVNRQERLGDFLSRTCQLRFDPHSMMDVGKVMLGQVHLQDFPEVGNQTEMQTRKERRRLKKRIHPWKRRGHCFSPPCYTVTF